MLDMLDSDPEIRAMAERDLIERSLGGSRSAFEMLITPLIDPAYRLAFAMLRRREEAEDAVQEASFKAWHRLGQLRPDTVSIRPWFLKIVANECRSQRRTRWWAVLRIGTPEERWRSIHELDLEGRTDLRRSLELLPEDQRVLIHLFYWLDLSMEEIAAFIGVSESAARGRLYRAVARLRRDLHLTQGGDSHDEFD